LIDASFVVVVVSGYDYVSTSQLGQRLVVEHYRQQMMQLCCATSHYLIMMLDDMLLWMTFWRTIFWFGGS